MRDLGWQGVVGNTDEMLFRPESLTEFASQIASTAAHLGAIGEMARGNREALGEERLTWLAGCHGFKCTAPMALVHASPEVFGAHPHRDDER